MKDPFDALKKALITVFQLEPMRNGNYIYPEIQQLKNYLNDFEPDNKKSFIQLLKALRAALPRIEKWRIDFNDLKLPMDYLAKSLNLPAIQWDSYLSRSNLSPKFQFGTHQDIDLLSWLRSISGNTATQSGHETLNLLLQYSEQDGFSQKLRTHLENKDPDFLYNLIMESEENFTKIARTRLVLYLTDEQLAEAIIKHIPCFVQTHPNASEQASQLIEKLNEILSNGRSVSTLLRNAEAKFILDSSEYLQIYQNGTSDSTNPSSPLEDDGLMPSF